MRRDMSQAFHHSDVTLEPNLRISHVGLRKGEASPLTEMRKGVLESQTQVDVVKNTDTYDRVDFEPVKAFTCLDVPEYNFGTATNPRAADLSRRLTQLDGNDSTTGFRKPHRELSRSGTKLEADDSWPQSSLPSKESCAPITRGRDP